MGGIYALIKAKNIIKHGAARCRFATRRKSEKYDREIYMEVKVNALVLRAADYGENDKILTLLTAERGKLSAGIKGVKKAGAKLKFAAQPFCLAEYILACRGSRYTVVQASESESFYDIRCDISKFYAASALCEAAAALTYEDDPSPQMFLSAVEGLRDMCAGDESFALIKFLARALSLSGYGFSAGACSECGKDLCGEGKLRFDMSSGSFTCWDCGTGYGVSGSTYAVLRAAEGRPCCEITDDGKKRALRLLREFYALKTDNRCVGLSEFIRLGE